jgi:hypothetical protein
MLQAVRELRDHIQLKEQILQHFVPREVADKVEQRAVWNDDLDDWTLAPFDARAAWCALRAALHCARAATPHLVHSAAAPCRGRPPPSPAARGLCARRRVWPCSWATPIRKPTAAARVDRPCRYMSARRVARRRFRADNVLTLPLDLPERTTQDYADGDYGAEVPRRRAAVAAMLTSEPSQQQEMWTGDDRGGSPGAGGGGYQDEYNMWSQQ